MTRARHLARWARQHWRVLVALGLTFYIAGPVADIGAAEVRTGPCDPGGRYVGPLKSFPPCEGMPTTTARWVGLYLSHPTVRIVRWGSNGGVEGFGICDGVAVGCE